MQLKFRIELFPIAAFRADHKAENLILSSPGALSFAGKGVGLGKESKMCFPTMCEL